MTQEATSKRVARSVLEEAAGKKETSYEAVQIPEEFGPVQLVVDDHKIKTFAFTQDDYRSWYLGDSPFGGRIGHANILANDLLWLFFTKYSTEDIVGLHTEEELWFHNPVFAGEQVTLQGKYVDKFEKRGKGYVVMEAEARGEDGRLLIRHRGTEIMRIQPNPGRGTAKDGGPRVSGEYREDVAPAEQARAGIEPKTPIVPLVKRVTQEQTSVFSGIGQHFKNIHTDLNIAREAGYDLPLTQAMQQVGYLTEMLTNFFGASWFTSGWEKLKFIRPVHPGHTLTARGVVTGSAEEEEGTRLELEIWVEREDGEKTAVGWASARVTD